MATSLESAEVVEGFVAFTERRSLTRIGCTQIYE
jgi:hypothetical protein